jgi:crotonobetainyl-CoA:carnitine CoA-transferase CaiB-like acyl-CoA transferase
MLEMNFMHWTYAGRETSRCGNRLLGPWFILDCADGQCFVVCVEGHQWQALVEFMGNPEWAKEEIFKDRITRGTNMDALFALMGEWASTWKVQDLFREGQKRRIPFAPVNRMGEIYADEHLKSRSFFVEMTHPVAGRYRVPSVPFRSKVGSYALRRAAPRLGEAQRRAARRARRARRNPLRGGRIDGGASPRRSESRRLHVGLGGTVRDAPARAPRRRGHPDREREAADA